MAFILLALGLIQLTSSVINGKYLPIIGYFDEIYQFFLSGAKAGFKTQNDINRLT